MIKYCGIFDMPCDDVGYNMDLEDDYCIHDCNSCPECYNIDDGINNRKDSDFVRPDPKTLLK